MSSTKLAASSPTTETVKTHATPCDRHREITKARIGCDDSLVFLSDYGVELQLSARQIQSMLAMRAHPDIPARELGKLLQRTDGPATASDRASFCRMLRLLIYRGLAVRTAGRLRLTPRGGEVLMWAEANGCVQNVNTGDENDTPLTFGEAS